MLICEACINCADPFSKFLQLFVVHHIRVGIVLQTTLDGCFQQLLLLLLPLLCFVVDLSHHLCLHEHVHQLSIHHFMLIIRLWLSLSLWPSLSLFVLLNQILILLLENAFLSSQRRIFLLQQLNL